MARTKTFDQTLVVDKAIQLFTATGYHGTSAQDLVDTLGLSRSSLYDTFGDKQGLFMKALEQYCRQAFGMMIEQLDQTSDLPATLRHLFHLVIQENVYHGFQGGCLLVNSATELAGQDTAVSTLIQESMQALEDAFCRAIGKARQAGQISDQHDARSLARFFNTTLTGLRVMAKTGSDRQACEDVMQVALSLI